MQNFREKIDFPEMISIDESLKRFTYHGRATEKILETRLRLSPHEVENQHEAEGWFFLRRGQGRISGYDKVYRALKSPPATATVHENRHDTRIYSLTYPFSVGGIRLKDLSDFPGPPHYLGLRHWISSLGVHFKWLRV